MCNWMIKSFLHQFLLIYDFGIYDAFGNLLEDVSEAGGAHVIR